MIVRRIRADDADLLRTVRLRALEDSPQAFASTFAEESALLPADWVRRATRDAAGSGSALFIALDGDDPVGMAGGFEPKDRGDERHLWGMWVAPEARRGGVGQALAGAVIDWASRAGATGVTLWLAEGNAPAAALYEQLGFTATGRRQPLPSHPGVMEQFLLKEIENPGPPT